MADRIGSIYVAGKAIARANRVMNDLTAAGYTIAFDWVLDINAERDPRAKALLELAAIQTCDVLVYLWEAGQESARYEAGMAMGRQIPVIVVADHDAFFFALPEVQRVDSDAEVLPALARLTLACP